jgi:L-iditol 2-dehydrogenase
MRQAVIVAADRFAVLDAPRPELRDDGEIILKTDACGICSGDLMPWYLTKKVGTVLGHEPVGRAIEVGSSVSHIRVGDLVFVHHHAPCLKCDSCRRGAFVHCDTWKATKLDPGGMAEYIRAAAPIVSGDSFAVNDLHPEQALFIEPLGCCVKALERLGGRAVVSGKRVAVIGCGIMGLLHIQTALAYGAGEIVVVEPDPVRRNAALQAGAREALTPDEARCWQHAIDIVIIGPGHPAVIRQGLEYVRPGGIASLFTPTADGVLTELDLGELYFREVILVPSYSCGPADTKTAYDLIRSGAVRPREMITHRFGLEQVQTAFDTAKRGGPAIKVIVTFGEQT